jgi:hypothetical protein
MGLVGYRHALERKVAPTLLAAIRRYRLPQSVMPAGSVNALVATLGLL